ncbi:MAG: hypothetical protein LBP55_08845 [Candidatus Adiutrix sp.]|jgi:hypothetical protein|nr:hypothetical protein [Candidatus Adiutrix sp.]
MKIPKLFGLIWLTIAGLTLALLPLVSKLPQKYADLFYELLALSNLNKTGELRLFALIALTSLGLMYYLDRSRDDQSPSPLDLKTALLYLVTLFPLLLMYGFWGQAGPLLLLLVYLIAYGVKPGYAVKSALLWFCLYWAWSALSVFIPALAGGLEPVALAAVVALPVLYLTFRHDNEILLDKSILLAQGPIPLALGIFLQNTYLYKGQEVTLEHDLAYQLIFMAVMAFFLAYNLTRIAAALKKTPPKSAAPGPATVERLILLSTVCCLAVYMSHFRSGLLVPSDWHHYGERIDPWNQIVSFGQIAYQDYFPPSGLFPLVNGFFLNVVLDGSAANIYPALSLESAFFWLLIAGSLFYVGGSGVALLGLWLLPFGTDLAMGNYERYHLVTLSLILLGAPALLRDLNRWLQAWLLLTGLNLMYYPALGAALGLGGVAFALPRLWGLYQDRGLQLWRPKLSFWAGWLVTLALIAPFTPLLARMVAVSAVFGSDVVPAYGVAIFQLSFYIGQWAGQHILLNIMQFIALITPLLIPAYIARHLFKKYGTLKKSVASYLWYFCALGLAFLPMAYQFSLVPMVSPGLNRAGGPVAIVTLLAIIGLVKHGQEVFSPRARFQLVLIAVLLLAPLATRFSPYRPGALIITPAQSVMISEADRQRLPRLGRGFINREQLGELNRVLDFLEKNNLKGSSFYSGWHLLNYILNLKALGAGNYYPVKGYQTSKLYYDAFKDRPFAGYPLTAGFPQTMPDSAYIWYWLVMDKKVVETPEGYWLSPELAGGHYRAAELRRPDDNLERGGEVTALWRTLMLDANSGSPGYSQLANSKYYSSFGRSMDSLRPIFIPGQELGSPALISLAGGLIIGDHPSFLYEFDPRPGQEADHIYLQMTSSIDLGSGYFQPWDFSGHQIRLHFRHNGRWDFQDLEYGDGRLLIPVGNDAQWLYETIDGLKVEFTTGFARGDAVGIEKLELLKLNRYRD